MSSRECLSNRRSILIDQNAGEKTLILQAPSPAVFDTLFESSQAQRLQNQSVYAEVVYRLSLYGYFLSLCYRRSVIVKGLRKGRYNATKHARRYYQGVWVIVP